METHGGRKHSKFSASGAERWFQCPGSVELSEGIPSKDSVWSLEGTQAHEVLEHILRGVFIAWATGAREVVQRYPVKVPEEMVDHGMHAALHIMGLLKKAGRDAELMIEERVLLDFIHPEAFGSLDAAVVDHFGTLHILDYKYGRSLVSPKDNKQFLFYALAVARKYDWNFKRVRMWTLQPRVHGFDGYTFWEIGILDLKKYVPIFKAAVEAVEMSPKKYVEGDHCHWCNAKAICPLKTTKRIEQAKNIFTKVGPSEETENKTGDETGGKIARGQTPKENQQKEAINGEEKSSQKSESRPQKENGQKGKAQRPKDFFQTPTDTFLENFAGYDDGDFF